MPEHESGAKVHLIRPAQPYNPPTRSQTTRSTYVNALAIASAARLAPASSQHHRREEGSAAQSLRPTGPTVDGRGAIQAVQPLEVLPLQGQNLIGKEEQAPRVVPARQSLHLSLLRALLCTPGVH